MLPSIPDLTPKETELVARLRRGPKLSDARMRDALGIDHEAALRLHHTLRTKLGVDPARENLRTAVRRIFGTVIH